MKEICALAQERLLALRDEGYKSFQAKLMPEVMPSRIIGVRTPQVRALAKELAQRDDIDLFLHDLPHKTYDENNLHAFILALGKDFALTLDRVDAFLPYVDNWATCDQMRPKIFARHKAELKCAIENWLTDEHPFTVRFGLNMVLCHFLDQDFDVAFLQKAAELQSSAYYVNMMRAWLFATALAKQWDATLPFLTDRRLDGWTHNKTIQKGVESYRLDTAQKQLLRKLKRKESVRNEVPALPRKKFTMKTNTELKYHYHPAKGWMNDPNGLVFFNGYYHAFYQHQPFFEQPGLAPMVWGHARTKDFLHWEELPVALEADRPYDKDGVWSGTATVKDGVLYLFYASVSGDKQTVSVAKSLDGLHFEKYGQNPIIRDYPKDGSADFRDPAIFSENGVNYLMVASADTSKKTGNILLYRSENFTDWVYSGVLCEYDDAKYCECPSFVKCGEGYLLSISVCPNHAPHYFEVLYGDFDGRRFTKKITSHFQKGPDEYAGQIFHAPDGRNILISWIPGWDYQPERCVGCLSLPLEVKPEGERITAYPVAEVRGLLDENDVLTDAYVTERFIRRGEAVEIKVDLT